MTILEDLIALQRSTGHLRDEDLVELASRTRTPLHVIQGLCSFYPQLRRTPPAKLEVRGCRDVACHMRHHESPLEALEDACRERSDAAFTRSSCLGRCDQAPACSINGVPATIADAIVALGRGEVPGPTSATPTRAWQIDPHTRSDAHYSTLDKWLATRDEQGNSGRLIARLSESNLNGMGGAGFPTGRKWQLVAEQADGDRRIVCNADESEPGTFKDRALLDELPHLVVEGMALAGLAIGSREGIVFLRHEYERERESLEAEIARARELGALGENVFGSGFDFDLRIFVSPGGYILGEETALLEALEGRRGEPRNKPPYPGVSGLHGRPTLINNVETFAQVPRALETGRAELKVFSISGDVARPGVVEAPLGTPLDELVARCGGIRNAGELLAFLPGGASTGFLSARHRNIPMDWDSLRAAGSALGTGAILVVAKGADLLDLARNLTAFFRNESCGKCVPCRIGTEKALGLIDAGDDASLGLLDELHTTLRETSICGLGQAALNPIMSVLQGDGESGS